ncbi:lysozyme [Salmonella enterica subsp. enterica serovar Newport]|nr:lysozyme [Salmonella enterica subsp. enterica serovar Newport]
MFKLSAAGKAEMEQFEGRRNKLYDDATGKTIARAADAKGYPTIGVGHLVSKTDKTYDGKTLSDAEIDALFAADVKWAEDIINGLGLPLKQNQFDALVSFVYNVGPGKKGVKDGLITLRNGDPSSVLRNMRAGNIQAAGDSMLSWTRSAGKVMSGLVKRRQAERALLLGA